MSWFVTKETTVKGRRLMAFAPLDLTEDEREHVDHLLTEVSLHDWLSGQSAQSIKSISEVLGCNSSVSDIFKAATCPVSDEEE